MEPQQQENEEFNQDVPIQEPTCLEIFMETLRIQQEINLEMDIIPDLDLGEDEKMQSQSSGALKSSKKSSILQKTWKQLYNPSNMKK